MNDRQKRHEIPPDPMPALMKAPPPTVAESLLVMKWPAMLIIAGTLVSGALCWSVSTHMSHENRITALEANAKNDRSCLTDIKQDVKETKDTVLDLRDSFARHDGTFHGSQASRTKPRQGGGRQ